ncbi:MAG: hypothetical protein HDT16_02215 [Oscillibacter sp.]|nr:hypothetical protein [Oscillibacter sp.]
MASRFATKGHGKAGMAGGVGTADKEKPPSFEGGFSLMEKIEEKRYNSLGLSPKLALFYQFRVLFVNVDVA